MKRTLTILLSGILLAAAVVLAMPVILLLVCLEQIIDYADKLRGKK